MRLHLTQSSVSGQLRHLEEDLGVRLIRRSARQVSLTEVGSAFLLDAQRVLDQADTAARGIQRFQDGRHAGLRVGYLHDAIPERLPVALRRTTHEFPQTQVRLHTGEPAGRTDPGRR